jgi:SAM-dependent methyltransferase
MLESAENYVRSGKALRAQGRTAESVACLGKAVRLEPRYAEAYMLLGEISAEAQEWERAAEYCLKALAIVPESRDIRRHFAQCLGGARFRRIPQGIVEALLRCFHDPWLDSQELAWPAISILALDPKPLENPLFSEVMTRTVVSDPDFELFLTRVRREILIEGAHASAAVPVAVQCLNNEHIWDVTPEEEAAPKRDAVRFAMYAPISGLPESLRADLRSPLREKLLEWLEEAEIRKGFEGLSSPDETTLHVKAQYEENPFPRWFSTTALPPMSVAGLLRLQLPGFSPPDFYEHGPRMLIAGCGSGKEAIDMALRHPDARITAIDITTASLSHAVRMARRYEVSNVRFHQLSLLDAARLGETFELVECSGVLNAIADPFDGWKALLDVLRPDGLMYVGIYSELARASIVSARAWIARSGMGLRAFRQEILRYRESAEARELLAMPEFYSASGCRDQLFHVHERRFTIPEIRGFLETQGLRFLGFLFRSPRVMTQYEEMFPRADKTDLRSWHAFELKHPETFRHQYCFYCQKPK